MAALTSEQKRFLVERLACFDTPTEACEAFKERFETEIARQQAFIYDASKPHLRESLSEELVAYFDQTRQAFRERTDDIPIANRAFRLKTLNKMVRDLMDNPKPNRPLIANLLEQAAKERGDVYVNRQKLDLSSLTADQLQQLLETVFGAGSQAAGA